VGGGGGGYRRWGVAGEGEEKGLSRTGLGKLRTGSWAMARRGSWTMARYRMLTQAADNRNWLVDWHATCGDHA